MPLEDAAMYLSIPETTVMDPADYAQLESITRQLPGITKGVTYTRFVRKGIIKVYEDGSEFEIGKGVVLHESDKDVATIITSGIMVDESLKAYEALAAEGISVRVIDMFTWKPLDEELVIKPPRRPAPSLPLRTTTSPAAWAAWWPIAWPRTLPPSRNLWAFRINSAGGSPGLPHGRVRPARRQHRRRCEEGHFPQVNLDTRQALPGPACIAISQI